MEWTIRKLIEDMPQQFKTGETTNVICDAIDKQFQELAEVFYQIETLTDINSATGKQLDAIGDILNLTRAEAALLCGGSITFDVLDDETYRQYLKYTAVCGTSSCTYYDLVKCMKEVLGEDVNIYYYEDVDFPATIILEVTGEDADISILPTMKPAGVSVNYMSSPTTGIQVCGEVEGVYATGVVCSEMRYCGTWPEESK